MPRITAPLLRIKGRGFSPRAEIQLLRMPVSSSMATHARVLRRKLMHMGSITSIERSLWRLGVARAMV